MSADRSPRRSACTRAIWKCSTRLVELPFVDRTTLAALYRRATLALLPSEREGFGLPLVESLACGTPVVASDIPALREVGGSAASYCPVADVSAWRDRILALVAERDKAPAEWRSPPPGRPRPGGGVQLVALHQIA